MEEILNVVNVPEVLTFISGAVAAVVALLIGKLPTKIKEFVVTLLDKTDAKLDADKEPKE